MKIVLWCKGQRSLGCLKALLDKKYRVELLVATPGEDVSSSGSCLHLAREHNIKTIQPSDPNTQEIERALRVLNPDLFILAGYGRILKANIISIPRIMCINLHAGKLPQYRGSSPMNWALIRGEKEFSLSLIKVDPDVDTGDVLLERTFKISVSDTIGGLHRIANKEFPQMLIEAVDMIEKNRCRPLKQDSGESSYYPLRFPDDGLILWDMCTAEEAHNRIRALTRPYPCAYTFFNDKKVILISSELCDPPYYGEPGRVYRKSARGILVCAQDKCLWITEAFLQEDNRALNDLVRRYEKLVTVKGSIESLKNQNIFMR